MGLLDGPHRLRRPRACLAPQEHCSSWCKGLYVVSFRCGSDRARQNRRCTDARDAAQKITAALVNASLQQLGSDLNSGHDKVGVRRSVVCLWVSARLVWCRAPMGTQTCNQTPAFVTTQCARFLQSFDEPLAHFRAGADEADSDLAAARPGTEVVAVVCK